MMVRYRKGKEIWKESKKTKVLSLFFIISYKISKSIGKIWFNYLGIEMPSSLHKIKHEL